MTHQHSCSVVQRWIHLSLDGELPPEIEPKLDGHVDTCHDCRQYWEEARQGKDVLDEELGAIAGKLDDILGGRLESSVARFEDLEARRRAKASASWLTPRRAAAVLVLGVLCTASAWVGWSQLSLDSRADTIANATWHGNKGVLASGEQRTELHDGAEHNVTSQHELIVPRGASVSLVYVGSASRVEVVGPARFSLRRQLDEQHFRLRNGHAEFNIAPSPGGFFVRTPAAVVRVVGTRFSVEHDETVESGDAEYPGLSKLEVFEGQVVFWRRSWLRDRGAYRPLPLSAGDRGEVKGRRVRTFHHPRPRAGAVSPTQDPVARANQGSRASPASVPNADAPTKAGIPKSGQKLDLPTGSRSAKPGED